jgi:putative transposase
MRCASVHHGGVLWKEFSKSTVSDLCKELDAVLHAWNERDLTGSWYPFLLVDAQVRKRP